MEKKKVIGRYELLSGNQDSFRGISIASGESGKPEGNPLIFKELKIASRKSFNL
jgi:hypothetical protein